jgi:hypothetical protein
MPTRATDAVAAAEESIAVEPPRFVERSGG